MVFIAWGSPVDIIITDGINTVITVRAVCSVFVASACHMTPKRAAVRTFELLIELLHSVADGLSEALHDVAHHAEVRHIVDVSFLRRRGDGLQLVLISVFHTWREEREGQTVIRLTGSGYMKAV